MKFVLPAWEALTVIAPAPVMVTVLPEMFAGPERIVKLTTNRDEAVALTGNAAPPKVLSVNALKVIV